MWDLVHVVVSWEKVVTPHSSTVAWKIPWMEEPGRLQSMGSPRVGHDWATSLSLFTFMHWRRTWQPTPVFLPGESQGRRSLVGCRLWGHTESDMNWSDLASAAAVVSWLGFIFYLYGYPSYTAKFNSCSISLCLMWKLCYWRVFFPQYPCSTLSFSLFFVGLSHRDFLFLSLHSCLSSNSTALAYYLMFAILVGFPGDSDGNQSVCSTGDVSSISGLGRSPGERNGNPLQYSCLENSMDRRAWQATVHGVERVRHDWEANTFTFFSS